MLRSFGRGLSPPAGLARSLTSALKLFGDVFGLRCSSLCFNLAKSQTTENLSNEKHFIQRKFYASVLVLSLDDICVKEKAII